MDIREVLRERIKQRVDVRARVEEEAHRFLARVGDDWNGIGCPDAEATVRSIGGDDIIERALLDILERLS